MKALRKAPSSVRAERELAKFILSLEKGCYLEKIISNGIDTLKENMFAGEKVAKRKFPKYYVDKYKIHNLYKMNLDSKNSSHLYACCGRSRCSCHNFGSVLRPQTIREKVWLPLVFEVNGV